MAAGALDKPTVRPRINWVTIFTVGYVLKVVGDHLGVIVDPVFSEAAPSPSQVRLATVGFYGQILFDFQGYSLMAVGLGKMFGFNLPINFVRPYSSTSIIDFWRRWHITLSRWLRDYVYFPLGGNRFGNAIRFRNLLLVMLVGGFWHGAAWTFVAWGIGHGLLLILNHTYRLCSVISIPRPFGWLLTQTSVLLLWILFRSESFEQSIYFFKNVFSGVQLTMEWKAIALLVFIVTVDYVAYFWTLLPSLRPLLRRMIFILGCFALALAIQWQNVGIAEFIYFQF